MIAIIDYGAGNLASVERAVRQVGFTGRVTRDPEAVGKAGRVIFPGVGAAGQAMAEIRSLAVDRALREAFKTGKPILGICIGAQVVLEQSEENSTECLGILPGRVQAFPPGLADEAGRPLKIPHMGWNGVRVLQRHPVLEGLRPIDEFYFVHSYYPRPADQEHVLGVTSYGMEFPSIIGYRNLIACQFHLEKSGPPGLRMLRNFCAWDGRHAE